MRKSTVFYSIIAILVLCGGVYILFNPHINDHRVEAIGVVASAIAMVWVICFSLYSLGADTQETKLIKKSKTLAFTIDAIRVLETICAGTEESVGFIHKEYELIGIYFPKYRNPYSQKDPRPSSAYFNNTLCFCNYFLKKFYLNKPYFADEFTGFLDQFHALIKQRMEECHRLVSSQSIDVHFNKEIKERSNILLQKMINKMDAYAK